MTAKITKIEQNARNAYRFQQKSAKFQTIMAIDSNELREARHITRLKPFLHATQNTSIPGSSRDHNSLPNILEQ